MVDEGLRVYLPDFFLLAAILSSNGLLHSTSACHYSQGAESTLSGKYLFKSKIFTRKLPTDVKYQLNMCHTKVAPQL